MIVEQYGTIGRVRKISIGGKTQISPAAIINGEIEGVREWNRAIDFL